MREQGSKAQMLSGDSMNNVEFWTIAGEAAEGMIFTFAPEPRNFPEAKDLVARFKAEGYDPEGYTLYTYAAFQMYAQAAAATGTTDSKKLAEWLRAGNPMKTVLGEHKFSKGGYAEDPSIN
jgi:branched-chain amino acid transport system substrate-binding protein